jgi:hypothetical protein
MHLHLLIACTGLTYIVVYRINFNLPFTPQAEGAECMYDKLDECTTR